MKKSTSGQSATFRWLVFSLVCFGVGSMSWKMLSEPAPKPETTIINFSSVQKPKVDKEADKILKQMSDYLTGLQQFSYKSKGSFEDITKDNKKIKNTYTSEVYVKRPNKLRVNTASEDRAASIYYDGTNFTVMGKKMNLYAQAKAPATLNEALDAARDKLQLDPPGADMLYTDPYTGLMEEVLEGKFKGDDKINGTPCNHLAFKGKEVDWEVWIEKGSKPLPRKYLIISKQLPEKPEFSVEFSDWNVKPVVDNQLFAFTPPAAARKIEFAQAKEMRDEAKDQKK